MEPINPIKNAFSKIKNYGSQKYTSASLGVTKYTTPFTKLSQVFSGKYMGVVFSILFILLFSRIFQSIMTAEQGQLNTLTSRFMSSTINTYFYILIIIIILYVL